MGYLKTNRAAEDGLFVAESLRTYKDVVQENLVPIWQAKRPGEEPPRFDQMLEFMAEDLVDSRLAMLADLEVFLNETSGEGIDRKDRAEAVSDARHWYQFFRDHCFNTYGREEALAMGFASVTEEHPWRLSGQLKRVINCFEARDPEEVIQPKDERKAVAAIPAGRVVDVLTPVYEQLVGVLEELLSEARSSEQAHLRKEETYNAYVRKFAIHAKCSEMIYRWAGLDEEARRIKPSTRRPGRREAAVDDDAGADTSTP